MGGLELSWRTEWKALSDRIQGLLDAGRFYLATLQGSPGVLAQRILWRVRPTEIS